jgi:rhodanese-related sulfurtransferase
VRTPVEFAEVHVPQARNVPLDELEARFAGNFRKTSRFICCAAAASARRKRRRNLRGRFLQPVVVEGGTLAWIEANLPVTRGT